MVAGKDAFRPGEGKNSWLTGTAAWMWYTVSEFILGVKGDTHPFALYKDRGVPVVISTDDPGILRTSITEEYTRAVYRYNLSYGELKNIVSNSIEYSFLNDEDKNKVRDAYNFTSSESLRSVLVAAKMKGAFGQKCLISGNHL